MTSILRFSFSVLMVASVATAQQTFTERMNAQFDRRPPLVGDVLPDASGYTADGKPFALDADRGNITVLVFGCLT